MYQALYRKYRPRTFSDVVGQEHVITTLRNSVEEHRVAHAYLFTGSRGTGKTTISKILAKAVNCPHVKDGDPCGVCEVCQGIDDGSILDVVEIDAASNNGVDNIRDLREEAVFTPAVVKYRVYIIDEAHMLSIGAFNALLKIMEEPPEHVIFILATTEAHKIPATIVSRCQRFDFRRLHSEEIAENLQKIAEREGFSLEPQAALLIARLSEGGMRDAISLLDLCSSYAQCITVETVTSASGIARNDLLFSMAHAVLEHNLPQALEQLRSLNEGTADPTRICQQMTTLYRNLMVAKAVPDPADLIPCAPEELQEYQNLAQKYSLPTILYIMSVLQETLAAINRNVQGTIELEIALVKMCSPQLENTQEALLARIERLEAQVRQGIPARTGTAAPGMEQLAQSTPSPSDTAAASPTPAKEGPSSLDRADLEHAVPFTGWAEVLERLKTTNPPLYGALYRAQAYAVQDFVLIDSPDDLFRELIRTDKSARLSLHQAIIYVTGQKHRIGPFDREKYQIDPQKQPDPLDQVIQTMKDAGVPVHITNN